MPLYFKTIYIKKPNNPDTGKYYAKEVNFGMIETSRIAEIIAKRSGHSAGQLIGFFQDYFRRIENYVQAGNNVSMAPIGTFMPAFSCAASDKPEEVELKQLKNIHMNFRISSTLRKKMQPKRNYYGPAGEVELKQWK